MVVGGGLIAKGRDSGGQIPVKKKLGNKAMGAEDISEVNLAGIINNDHLDVEQK